MPADALVAFEPRKMPVQARSAVTVEAISEATIQVLLSHGAERLTTTRVAQRAGVSVGTLLQPGRRNFGQTEPELHISKEGDPVFTNIAGCRVRDRLAQIPC
jgi:hypothetical protein